MKKITKVENLYENNNAQCCSSGDDFKTEAMCCTKSTKIVTGCHD